MMQNKMFKIILLFILIQVNTLNSFENTNKVFLEYTKPKIEQEIIFRFITNNDSILFPINHIKFSILLNIISDSLGFVKEIKFDKLLSQTSSCLSNNDKFWYYIENQFLQVSKVWQIDLTNLKYFRNCEELLITESLNISEFEECKKILRERNYFQFQIIFSFNNDIDYLDQSIYIIRLN